MDELDIFLNKIAQAKLPIEEGILAYDQGDDALKSRMCFYLEFNISQIKASPESISKGIKNCPVRITVAKANAIKMAFQKCPFQQAIGEVYNLEHKEEAREACIVLLSIFKEADTHRRNTACKNGCNHPWHNL